MLKNYCACQYCVKNGLEVLMYSHVHSGFCELIGKPPIPAKPVAPIFALSWLRSLRFSTHCLRTRHAGIQL